MVPLTRRRLLHGTVALLASIAGCGQPADVESTETARAPRNQNPGTVPEHYALRNPVDEPPVWIPDRYQRGTTASASPTSEPPKDARQRGFIASADTAERTWFADVDGADEARQFVADTDFDTETIYVEQRSVRECHYLELCSVTWSDADIHTQFGSYYRDADASCRADAKDEVSWLIRIPDALDPNAIRSHGSGWSSSGCRRRRPPDETGTTTEAPDFGPKSPTNATRNTEDDR